MVATGTLRFMDGAELGGLELAESTTGSPTIVGSIASPAGRSGAFHYRCPGAATRAVIGLPIAFGSGGTQIDNTGGLSDAHFLFGLAMRFSDLSPSGNRAIMEVRDEGNAILMRTLLQADGDFELLSVGGITSLHIEETPFTINTWHYSEVAFGHLASGAWELWLDGVSLATGTADFEANVADDPWRLQVTGPASGDGNYDFDDIYVVSHPSTLQGNNLGPSEVFAYQVGPNSDVSDSGLTTSNDGLALGSVWDDAAETPIASIPFVSFINNPSDGARIFDEVNNATGHGRGPTSGAYTVDGTIQGAMWLGVYQRGTGGGSTHVMWYGEGSQSPISSFNMDTIENSVDTLRAIVSEDGGPVPTASQSFAMGAGTTGAQNIEIREQFAFLLHTPAAFDEAELAGLWSKGQQEPVREPDEVVAY